MKRKYKYRLAINQITEICAEDDKDGLVRKVEYLLSLMTDEQIETVFDDLVGVYLYDPPPFGTFENLLSLSDSEVLGWARSAGDMEQYIKLGPNKELLNKTELLTRLTGFDEEGEPFVDNNLDDIDYDK